ncbi:hypothetical protein MKW98_016898 [Papaver atlanticum]|uniref:Uncharacterized protein n=1 Tax=Papaver atlanticum TaxID=357466 RepID=A0AAD4XYA8_9MAGN|nr:hypothetical protein MKW98_016898 [Papaver atlanticum]
MDRNSAEFESMGILGIYREAYKVTLSQKKIFSQIALALLLPLALIFLAQTGIPVPPANNTQINSPITVVDEYQTGNFEDENQSGYFEYGYSFRAQISSETITPDASKAICWLLISILAVPSAFAVVYTVACIYSSRDITFRKATSVVPKVWKRLAKTFLWNFLIVLVYNTILLVILILVITKILPADPKSITLLSAITMVSVISSYVIGNMYIILIWLSSSITTILEDISGSKAVKKGKDLIKGKLWISLINYLTLQFCYENILSVFSSVLHGEGVAMVGRVSLGIVCLVLLVILLHFGLVIQTVIYLVCKSYHKESISLADHLDGFLPVSYTSLSSKENVQLDGEASP